MDRPKFINKLVIVVTENCNLRCSYCYVRLSSNEKKNGFMQSEDARKIIRNTLSDYYRCNLIQFFGGEPSLNLSAIESAIDETRRLVEIGKLEELPRFAIVTNGVFEDFDNTIDFLKHNGIETTVSLDGPSRIHNELRRDSSGAPTYERVVNTIKTLLNEGISVAMETVYTSIHVKKRYSIIDLFETCQEIGIHKLIFQTAYPPAPQKLNPLFDPYFDTLLSYYEDAVDWWFDSLINKNSIAIDVYFSDLLRPMLHGLPAAVAEDGCPAGSRDFAIGPNGDCYACQLLFNYPEFLMGNVIKGIYNETSEAFPRGSNDIARCRNHCFAKSWCQPCAALNMYWGNPWVPPSRECQLRKAVVLRLGYWAFSYLDVQETEIAGVLRSELRKQGLIQ